MYIGKAAQLTGASPKAIRHYESLGLLPGIQRAGEYRVYSEADVLAIGMIRQAQRLGFKLAELAALKALDNQPDWSQVLHLIERKRQAIVLEMARLQQLDGQLVAMAAEIRSCPGVAEDCSTFIAGQTSAPLDSALGGRL